MTNEPMKDDGGIITELAAQRPRSRHHDEMLFIIQHPTAELIDVRTHLGAH